RSPLEPCAEQCAAPRPFRRTRQLPAGRALDALQVCRVGVYNFKWNLAREIVSARFGMIWTCRCAEWHKRTETRTVAAGSPTLPVGHAMSLKTLLFSSRSGMIAAATGLGLCVPLLSGCADDQQMAAQYIERPIEQIYEAGWIMINRQNWLEAGRQFDEVERQHPYSVWARRAILMSAYCYYQGNRYDEAIDAATRFIQLHPGNKDVPYAYYLKAISLYEQIGHCQ